VKRACLHSNSVKLFRQIVEAIEKGEYDGQNHVFEVRENTGGRMVVERMNVKSFFD
jgi:hypothetical protein